MTRRLRLVEFLGGKPKERFFLKPVSLPHVRLICPTCEVEVTWTLPPNFQIAILGHLLATCPNQHRWVIAGAFERAENNDWMQGIYGIPEATGD